MKKVRKYLAESAEQEAPPSKGATECMVNGCPLPGVYRLANDRSICCVHDEEDAIRWPDQTTRIRHHERLFNLAFDMTNAGSGSEVPPKAIERIVAMGAPAPRHRDGERMTIRLYGAQIKGWLVKECKGKKEVPPEVKAKMDTWRSLREVV